MAAISAHTGNQRYRTEIKTTTHTLISDEPAALGGGDLGFSPDELLAASLGACTCATLRMYADRKGWAGLTGVQVDVTFNRAFEQSFMERKIVLEGDMTEEQKARLLEIANRCPVHRTLTHTIEINTTIG